MSAPRGAPNGEARAATLAEARTRLRRAIQAYKNAHMTLWTDKDVGTVVEYDTMMDAMDELVTAARREERAELMRLVVQTVMPLEVIVASENADGPMREIAPALREMIGEAVERARAAVKAHNDETAAARIRARGETR